MAIKSKALEINLEESKMDVEVDEKYLILQEIFSKYYGLIDGLNTFLVELSHPLRNWDFIVQEARGYSLDYFHLLKGHSGGGDAAALFVDIFTRAIDAGSSAMVQMEAADNLLLFLQKVLNESGTDIRKFMPAIQDAFDRIRQFENEQFFLFVKSYYQMKRLGEAFLESDAASGYDCTAVNQLLIKYFDRSFRYWLNEEDPRAWFEKELGKKEAFHQSNGFFSMISHQAIQDYRTRLNIISREGSLGSAETTKALLALPGYNEFVGNYRAIPQKLFDAGEESERSNYWKVIFLFHIMNISGLSVIHEETLRDINRTLTWLIANESLSNATRLIQKTFSILKTRRHEFPATALNCVLNMGKGVYNTDDIEFINFFIDQVIDLGFELPRVGGVGDDWQIKVNPAHIQNIRTWMELIELNPKRSIRLLSHLIIHLALCGVLIKDTDLFPRDITRFLNSDIGSAYNLAKQVARLFPSYFNDIGAEGKLREISTRLDEMTHRRDILIHFLRKQSHVESSNLIIGFMEAVLHFWETRDKAQLEPFVPPNIFRQILSTGAFIDHVSRILSDLRKSGVALPEALLTMDTERLEKRIERVPDVSDMDRERVLLIVAFYKLLNQKYHTDFIDINSYLERLKVEAFPDLDQLQAALCEDNLEVRIGKLLDYLEKLKQLILSDRTYEIREDIYKKRHFTVDIPSMYGSYNEMKFDALGLTFRIESLVNVLFEDLVEDIDLSLITKATFYQIYNRLLLFGKALKIEGISSLELERQVELLSYSLEVKGFTFSQYLDIFKGFVQCVKNIINDYFNNIHGQNLTRALARIPVDQIQSRFLPVEGLDDAEKLRYRVSEIFFRDRITLSLGLQQMDLFLSRILNTLFHQANKLPKDKLHQLLLYDPQRVVTPIDNIRKMLSGLIDLGNKGYNLSKLEGLRLPVPPGFIITTEAFRWRILINSYLPAQQNFREQVVREITDLEKKTGKKFGNPKKPLLLAIRSGSTISQPGMMDTFLDVGANEEIIESLSGLTGNPWFAWDNYRRFLQCWGMAFGLERDDFDAIISEYKRRWSIRYKREFTGDHMKKVALTYKHMIQDSGIEVMEDPFEQLFLTIKLIFASWNSSKARTYRKIMGISDDWGTAVAVQSMVFGNMSRESGSGVIFTHNPRWSGDTLQLWGDFTLGNQGEDVVSGLVNTLPISLFQQEIEKRETDITMETHFPEIYQALKGWAMDLVEKNGWPPQEVEFTFEGPRKEDLFLLQGRDMSIRESKKVYTFDLDAESEGGILGSGIGVSGGAMSGRLVFSLEEIDQWRKKEPDTSLILVRGDTVPDDIREIFSADGLLTAKGGVTSHAAVVAHRLEKTCVVGCGNLTCNEKRKMCSFNRRRLNTGDFISIDGREGSVYEGYMKIREAG